MLLAIPMQMKDQIHPLVRQIVDDLIHTTDCYLALKQQASSGIQHVNHLTDKASLS